MGIMLDNINLGGGTSSNTSHNIGDIFYTTRTDSILNGAVECDGSQYNFSDINGGDNNILALLEAGKLPYLPISEFDSMVFNHGGCDSFGYYNNDSSQLKWWVWDEYTESGNNILYTLSPEPKVGDLALNFYGLDENISYTDKLQDYNGSKKTETITFVGNAPEGTESDGFDISGRYCVIANETYFVFSTHNQTKEKPRYDFTSTYFKVPKKLSRVLVRTQKPAAYNDYTWFNLYSDGWVEQGGQFATVNTSYYTESITLPVIMSNANYSCFISCASTGSAYFSLIQNKTTTGFVAYNVVNATAYAGGWQVSGYADSTEYTKDKWNYQNVQVERPMIQLFNSTTDTAVATYNQVLADVSVLNQGDYVIETQLPTEENNYSWYRLYKSGWVEQGKFKNFMGANVNTTCMLIIPMKDTNYFVTGVYDTNTEAVNSLARLGVGTKTTQSFQMYTEGGVYSWEVKGFSNITN